MPHHVPLSVFSLTIVLKTIFKIIDFGNQTGPKTSIWIPFLCFYSEWIGCDEVLSLVFLCCGMTLVLIALFLSQMVNGLLCAVLNECK